MSRPVFQIAFDICLSNHLLWNIDIVFIGIFRLSDINICQIILYFIDWKNRLIKIDFWYRYFLLLPYKKYSDVPASSKCFSNFHYRYIEVEISILGFQYRYRVIIINFILNINILKIIDINISINWYLWIHIQYNYIDISSISISKHNYRFFNGKPMNFFSKKSISSQNYFHSQFFSSFFDEFLSNEEIRLFQAASHPATRFFHVFQYNFTLYCSILWV